MTTVIISPHYDDAVFSAWTILQRGGTQVINVFTDCGPETERRAQEDREALSEHYSRGAVTNMGLKENGKSEPAEIMEIIARALNNQGTAGGVLMVPCAFGWHPHGDHHRTNEAAKHFGSQWAVWNYADFPYWMKDFRGSISYASVYPSQRKKFDKRYGREPDHFVRLSRQQAKEKLKAMLCYMGEIERFPDIKKGLHSGAWTEEAYWRIS